MKARRRAGGLVPMLVLVLVLMVLLDVMAVGGL